MSKLLNKLETLSKRRTPLKRGANRSKETRELRTRSKPSARD